MGTRWKQMHLWEAKTVHAEAPAAACTVPPTASGRAKGLSKCHTSSSPSRCHFSPVAYLPSDRLLARGVVLGRAGLELFKLGDRLRTGRMVKWHAGASTVHLQSRVVPDRDDEDRKDGKRARITEWSLKSRLRLKQELGRLTRAALQGSIFVTLTYPNEHPAPECASVYKAHLDLMLTKLRREFDACGFWKLEFQQRGAAHYHIMLLGVPAARLHELRQFVSREWYEVVGSGDPKHLAAGTNVEPSRTVNGCMCYMAKYMSKEDQTMPGNFSGRYWGKFNRMALPVGEERSLLLTDRQAVLVNRLRRKKVKADTEGANWRKYLDMRKKLPGNHPFITRTQFEYVWSCVQGVPRAKRNRVFVNLLGPDYVMNMWACAIAPVVTSPDGSQKQWRPPRRRRERSTITGGYVICNADKFMAAIARGIEQGIIA